VSEFDLYRRALKVAHMGRTAHAMIEGSKVIRVDGIFFL